MTDVWTVLTGVEAVGAAASGGAFLAYSTLTPAGIRMLPDRDGVAAWQAINLAAPRSPSFMALVFGPAILGIALGIRAVLDLSRDGAALVLAGALVYGLGVAVMTMAFHVPRNDRLATWDPDADAAKWRAWLDTWVAGNHIRTISGIASGALFLGGL